VIGFNEFYRFGDLGKEKMEEVHTRLFRLGLLLNHTSSGPAISSNVIDLIRHWDNPPLPDYRDKVTKWFWSKPWSMGIYILIIGIPALVGWVLMLKELLIWCGFTK
jgi:hypothetical protein